MAKKKKNRHRKSMQALLLCLLFLGQGMTAGAATVYVSDGVRYAEGYIIIGESHIVLAADGYSQVTEESGHVQGLSGVVYFYTRDGSLDVTEDGSDNTFTMSGNLFFVFEGNRETDAQTQYSKEYIYSDGAGNCGAGVKKIREIMENHPDIEHWNIISFQGAVSALEGKTAGEYYATSYQNWLEKDFPDADLYIVSHSIMTKYYKKNKKDAAAFDAFLQEAFPENYLDYTDFFNARYPDQMRDPAENPDTIHWSYETYIELFNDIIQKIQTHRGQVLVARLAGRDWTLGRRTYFYES